MEWIQATILGLIQGITEFLPISSSGHLVLVPHVFGWVDQGLMFDVAANTGSLLAVIVYFRRDVGRLIQGFARSLSPGGLLDNEDGRLAWSIVLATVPVGLAGLLFKDRIATLARDPVVVGFASIVFGVLLYWADRSGTRHRALGTLVWRDALWIGLAQALALVPGASRSGVTITAGLLIGFTRGDAARFSFLMAIPVGVLAGGLELLDLARLSPTPHDWAVMGWGLLVSALSAYLVIDWLLSWLQRQTMTVFVVYRLVLGGAIFALVL